MSAIYVLDACAMLALSKNEDGADVVDNVLRNAHKGLCKAVMHGINLLEVYYEVYRKEGETKANDKLAKMKQLPMTINTEISDQLFKEAGRLKATYKISLADSIALAQAIVLGAKLLTSDHHEFDIISEKELINFLWIR